MTLADLRRKLEQQMIVSQRVQQNEVLGKIAVVRRRSAAVLRRAQDRVHDSADDHAPRNFRQRCRATAPRSTSAATRRRGRRRETIRRRALAGESFEKLAADLSDAPSRANAGLIGPLNLNDLSQTCAS